MAKSTVVEYSWVLATVVSSPPPPTHTHQAVERFGTTSGHKNGSLQEESDDECDEHKALLEEAVREHLRNSSLT